jgi:hypothetical protein
MAWLPGQSFMWTSTMLYGFLLLMSRAALHREVLSFAVCAVPSKGIFGSS